MTVGKVLQIKAKAMTIDMETDKGTELIRIKSKEKIYLPILIHTVKPMAPNIPIK